jgi:hypothetical protein
MFYEKKIIFILPSTLMFLIIIPFINEIYMYNFVIPSIVKGGD